MQNLNLVYSIIIIKEDIVIKRTKDHTKTLIHIPERAVLLCNLLTANKRRDRVPETVLYVRIVQVNVCDYLYDGLVSSLFPLHYLREI